MASYDGSKSFPSTPASRKITIAKIVDNLNDEWPELRLRPRSNFESPSKRLHNDRELCYDRLAQCFYMDQDSLQPSIAAFRLQAREASSAIDLAPLLLQCLPSPTRREVASRRTPLSVRSTSKLPSASTTPVSSFTARIKSGPPRAKTPEPEVEDWQIIEPASPSENRGSTVRSRAMKRRSEGQQEHWHSRVSKMSKVSKSSEASKASEQTKYFTTPSSPTGRAFDSSFSADDAAPMQTSFVSTVPEVNAATVNEANISFNTNVTVPDPEPLLPSRSDQFSSMQFSSMPSLSSEVEKILDSNPFKTTRQSDTSSSNFSKKVERVKQWREGVQPTDISPNTPSKSSFGKSTTSTETREALYDIAETREALYGIVETREALPNVSPSQAFSQMRIVDNTSHPAPASPHKPQTVQSLDTSPQIRDLVNHGLFVPAWNAQGDIRVLWECQRWANFTGVSATSFFDHITQLQPSLDDLDAVATVMRDVLPAGTMAPPIGSRHAWQHYAESEVQYKARLSFTGAGPGSTAPHRLLYVDIPNLDNVPKEILGREVLKDRFLDWLCELKVFLGRTWLAVHFEQSGAKKGDDRYLGYRAVFLALSGHNLEPISVESALQEYMDLDNPANLDQSFRKLFARLDLGFSRTNPTLEFKKEQILDVPDFHADNTPENDEFRDKNEDWTRQAHLSSKEGHNLTDGCGVISVAAAKMAWSILDRDGPMPTAFQGRIRGAKGVWTVSGPADSTEARDLEVWIQIRDSQQKFDPPIDQLDAEARKHALTFDVSSVAMARSQESMQGALHMDMIPLLTYCGVPVENIIEVMTEALLREDETLLEILEDPVLTRYWVTARDSSSDEGKHAADDPSGKRLPISYTAKAKWLLDNGFHPQHCAYLVELLRHVADDYFSKAVQRLSVKLECSIHNLGVADPKRVLAPNTVHVGFSKSFIDKLSGQYTNAINRTALVTRFPMQLPSDIQKVTVVYDHRQAYLGDVIVFPTRGPVSLPSKLQGGDLDGDRFTLIWDPRLVDGFKNKPVPPTKRSPEYFGVSKDKRKLKDVLQGLSPVGNFLREGFKARLNRVPLGKTSNAIKNLAYRLGPNAYNSLAIRNLSELYTLMIDADKQGNDFDEEGFDRYIENEKAIHKYDKKAPKPAFEKAIAIGIKVGLGHPSVNVSGSHPNDVIYFQHIQPQMYATLTKIDAVLEKTQALEDEDLKKLCLQANKHADPRVREEDLLLSDALRELQWDWGKAFRKNEEPSNVPAIIEAFCLRYDAVMPKYHDLDYVSTTERLTGEPSNWALLKASTLYSMCCAQKNQRIVFQLAGKDLAYIKVHTQSRRLAITDIFDCMKLRKRKPRTAFEVDDEAGENGDDLVLVESNVATTGHTGGDDSAEDDTEEFVDARTGYY